MATYTFAQLERLWINAGGPAAVAPVAAAIALAESSGNSAATNPTDNNGTQTSWGLWQISNGTHAMPVPNILDPLINAQQAVAKYRASGWAPWGTYGSGAYRKYLQGSVPPAADVPGGGGTGGGAQTVSLWTDITDPFTAVAKSLGSLITNPWDIATSVTRLATDFNSLVGLFNTFMKDIEWLFVPSHWVRVFAFLFGVGALIPGVYALVKTGSGQQGDITLAIGILMVTAGGMLLFIAFHNLPTDVKDLGGLLGYVSQGIRTGSAPASGNAPLFAAGTPEAVQNAAQNAVSRP